MYLGEALGVGGAGGAGAVPLVFSGPGPKPYKFLGFGDIHGFKPYEFIGFGAIP